MAALSRDLLQRELGGPRGAALGAQSRLRAWSEASLTKNSAATYAAFQPPPRSTIALSYNCDGTLLASTHGDHTVKLSCCASGKLVRVLSGHRRTPWVVRFHPRKPALLASGSLDHEVRLWDAQTGQCIARHTFGKPIASLAFHVCADVLAIGCGHKLYMWEYAAHGKLPVIVLKTRRSMRAVHFHPHGLPVVLTAEVQDPSPTPELPATLTEEGSYLQPVAEPSCSEDEGEETAAATPGSSGTGLSAAPPSRELPFPSAQLLQGASSSRPASAGVYVATADGPVPVGQLAAGQQQQGMACDAPTAAAVSSGQQPQSSGPPGRPGAPGWVPPNSAQLPPSMVPTGWELPFPASLFAGGDQPAAGAAAGGGAAQGGDPNSSWAATAASLPQVMAAFSAAAWNIIGQEQPPRVRLRLWRFDADKPTALLAVLGAEQGSGNLQLQVNDTVLCSEMGVHFSACGRMLACTTACRGPLPAAVGVAAGAMLGDDDPEGLQPTQQEVDAALAAALGGNVRPEVLLSLHTLAGGPPGAAGPGLSAAAAMRTPGAASELLDRAGTGPGAAAAAAEAAAAAAAAAQQQMPERVVFEVRVFSLDGPSFGQVVRAKRIRAAHCLTSVQFSPCCNHLLLAYGKKHISLLRSLVAERGSVLPLHTILEVLRLKDMELVRVLPSADDEINAACFHPRPGGGIAYGTKEGRLRIIAHDRSRLAQDPAEGGADAPAAAASADDGAATAGVAASAAPAGSGGGEEGHPTQRELDNLRDWVMTQQWLQHQALGGTLGGGPQLQAMQQLWERGEPGSGGSRT